MERIKSSFVIVEKGSEEPLCVTVEGEFYYLIHHSRNYPIFECRSEKQAIEVVHFPTIEYNSSPAHPCTDRVGDLLPDKVKVSTMRITTEFKALKYEPPTILKPVDTFTCPPSLVRQICNDDRTLSKMAKRVYMAYALVLVKGDNEAALRKLIGKPVFFGDRFLKRMVYGLVSTKSQAFPELRGSGGDFALVCSDIIDSISEATE